VHKLTQVQDILPTLIKLCGLKNENPDFDGTSLSSLLKGSTTELPDRKLIIQYRTSGEKWDPAVVLWDKWRLIKTNELYNVADDPHQDQNVAEQHPEIVKSMLDHYDAWYAETRPLFDIPRWINAGTTQQNPMMLYAQDWVGDYCDNRGGLTQGRAVGYWNVDVKRDGIYELELRRWPEESQLPISAGYGSDFKRGMHGQRDVVAANLKVSNKNYTLDCQTDDTHVTFRVHLKAGKQQLATRLSDDKDQTLCSAMYVKLTHLTKSTKVELTPASTRKRVGIDSVGESAPIVAPAKLFNSRKTTF
jgi:hypothetical protein